METDHRPRLGAVLKWKGRGRGHALSFAPSKYLARNGDAICQSERHDRLRRNGYILVPGEHGTRGAGACADEATNQRSLTTTCQTANQCTRTSAATNHRRCTFAFALHRLNILTRSDGSAANTRQFNGERSLTLETSLALGRNHRSGHRSACLEDGHTVYDHRGRQRARKRLAD